MFRIYENKIRYPFMSAFGSMKKTGVLIYPLCVPNVLLKIDLFFKEVYFGVFRGVDVESRI